MKPLRRCWIVLLCGWVLAAMPAPTGAAAKTRAAVAPGASTEMHLPLNAAPTIWGEDRPGAESPDPDAAALPDGDPDEGAVAADGEVAPVAAIHRIKVCRTETVCILRYKEGYHHRVRVKHLIAPLPYTDPVVEVPAVFLEQVRLALDNLVDKHNVTIRFVAHTDNSPLNQRDASVYGDHDGLTRAVARRVALAVRERLGLSENAVEGRGAGAARPLADNATPQGKALNRRVAVEFWHDDPVQEMPAEPQQCPEPAAPETVTRVYDPPSGPIAPLRFADGRPVVPAGYSARLQRIMDEIGDKENVRLRFVGYTANRRLDRRTAAVYGDDIGLSMARARRAMAAVQEQMGVAPQRVTFDGRGYVQADDVVNEGFTAAGTSHVRVQVVYDAQVYPDDDEGMAITPVHREVVPVDPFALNHMRITVDGRPLDDPNKCSADVQRCTDVALESARIRFKHDTGLLEPRLNVSAWPRSVGHRTAPGGDPVQFRLYTNYHHFIQRAEVRLFEASQSLHDTPAALVTLDADGRGIWRPDMEGFTTPVHKLKYVARVYDAQGHYDETTDQPLWVVDRLDQTATAADPESELLIGYGESRLATRNISLRGGTVQVHGTHIPPGYGVWLAGRAVPVDAEGRFVAEAILPEGLHTVEVAVLDAVGNGELFLRDLALKPSDWFTVGLADLTLSANQTSGPAELLAMDRPQYSEDMSLHGRLAFYSSGKFSNGWRLTASADTREGPLEEIFSNFMDKSPDGLFRRIDPDHHYPTFGDDGTVVEDAPTRGKFYVRAQKDETHAMWGNFKVSYKDNTLGHVDRGLYGANVHYRTPTTTAFGEQRFLFDGFAADPGTVAGRDEFRGTNGSLYYLRRQDLLEGSESARIEVRDKDSGMVLAVKHLAPVLDYDIDYFQGRMLLAQPLPATADDGMLVSSGSVSGNPVYLVVRYEFTPGFDNPDTLAVGGRAHYWFGDYLKVGVTANQDEEAEIENRLAATDITLRKSAQSWLRLEAGHTKGPGVRTTLSDDGGFNFGGGAAATDTAVSASAHRVDGSIGVHDFWAAGRGQLTFYQQHLAAGYAAPGLAADRALTQYGGTAHLPVGAPFNLRLKADVQAQDQGLETEAGELNLDWRLGDHWTLSSGVRQDSRTDNSPVVPLTQEEGARTDLVARLHYDARTRWTLYGFGQETVQRSGNRSENARIGAGGSLRLTDRFTLTGELSEGDLGTGARLGTEYLYSDRTTIYLNYALENERSDNGLRATRGNMASGFRTRYSDSVSVFLEERYTHGDVPTGLMHATGVDLAPTDRINLGAKLDYGTLKDHQTAAETKRTAIGVNAGYGFARLKIASALEYREDDIEHRGAGSAKRTSWLLKNSFRLQLSPDWRMIGKFNHAWSESSLGSTYDGNYTEAVVGYAYRPIRHDRLNTLFKYTYFYNLPSADQLTGSNNAAANIIQRSHILALDAMYDLTARWTVGGKYAYRHGEVAQDRVNPEFFASRAHLYVLRADWHFIYRWDALFELRMLDLPDAADRRQGALVALYRQLGNHIKMGLGYNFSDFSDDLTRMDYRHQGVFINLIGKY